jgi:hypothetical protein
LDYWAGNAGFFVRQLWNQKKTDGSILSTFGILGSKLEGVKVFMFLGVE